VDGTLLAGRTVAVKENIDIAGRVAAAGSPALVDAPPAAADAEIVRRWASWPNARWSWWGGGGRRSGRSG